MTCRILPAGLLALLLALLVPAPAPAGPPRRCPHLVHDFARYADLPLEVRALLVSMAEPGQPFQTTDATVIIEGEPALPNTRFISARRAGCTLTVTYELGGRARGFGTKIFEQRDGVWQQTSPAWPPKP